MRISHKRLTIWKTTFAVLLPIYGHKCWKKSSKIGRPDWTTSEPAVAVICQKSYLKSTSDEYTATSVELGNIHATLLATKERINLPLFRLPISIEALDTLIKKVEELRAHLTPVDSTPKETVPSDTTLDSPSKRTLKNLKLKTDKKKN
ncbi:zinc finger protein [Trichonephila clavipes]|nr:zinc finger protein [Trichonephila clavipes]